MAVLDRGRIHTGETAARAVSEPSRLSIRFLVAALILVGLAALLPVLVTSTATERGAALRSLEQQRAELRASVEGLEAEIAVLTSTDHIARDAKLRLGMVEPDRILYVTVEGAAPSTTIPERLLSSTSDSDTEPSDPWWRRLVDLLPRP